MIAPPGPGGEQSKLPYGDLLRRPASSYRRYARHRYGPILSLRAALARASREFRHPSK
jgi:hypothetical protein